MIVAAKTLARTALDIFNNPEIAARAQAEFHERRGPDFRYVALLGERDPPLNYRGAVDPGLLE